MGLSHPPWPMVAEASRPSRASLPDARQPGPVHRCVGATQAWRTPTPAHRHHKLGNRAARDRTARHRTAPPSHGRPVLCGGMLSCIPGAGKVLFPLSTSTTRSFFTVRLGHRALSTLSSLATRCVISFADSSARGLTTGMRRASSSTPPKDSRSAVAPQDAGGVMASDLVSLWLWFCFVASSGNMAHASSSP